MAETDVSPFAPPGVDFTGVSPALIKVRVIVSCIWLGGLAVIGAVLAVATKAAWVWAFPAVFVALLVWALWLVPRQVRAIGYAERDDDLLLRKGILLRSMVVVPYGRMQYVDVSAGPVARALGIASVQLHTAAAATDASIPGLPAAEAARLRDQLASRGESRRSGL
ncbi:MAG: PH domain-containing protein [Actinomycetales bacterium]|nr:PH domain-containing protein [Actinomycetales bacterium]